MPDVAHLRLRIPADDHRQRDVRPPSSGQQVMIGQLVEVDLVAAPDDFLARRRPALHARRELRDLQQPRQQRELAEQPFGHLEVEQLRDARAVLVEVLHAERERHALHRAEQVDRHRIRASASRRRSTGMLEQQRLAAARLLHHAVGDLAELELDAHRLPDAHELADGVDRRDELGERIEAHRFSPAWMAATPNVSGVTETFANPASRHDRLQLLARRKLRDALGQVPVRRRVAGNQRADERQHAPRIQLVRPSHERASAAWRTRARRTGRPARARAGPRETRRGRR